MELPNIIIQHENGDIITLRALKFSDYKDMYLYNKSENTVRYLGYNKHKSIIQTAALFGSYYNAVEKSNDSGAFAILLNNNFAGSIDFKTIEGRSWIAYILIEKYWGKGIITNVLAEVTKFIENNIDAIPSIKCLNDNLGSKRVIEKNEFKIIKKDLEFIKGKDQYVCYYEKLK